MKVKLPACPYCGSEVYDQVQVGPQQVRTSCRDCPNTALADNSRTSLLRWLARE